MKTEVAPIFVLPTFLHGERSALILTKNYLGDILDDFSTNSSGHPVGGCYFL
jgi:hypothetical protein